MLAVEAGNRGTGAALDVAVGRAGPSWLDADGDEAIGLLRGGDGIAHDRVVSGGILNELIGWQHQHGGIGIAGGDQSDAERDRRGGVAFGGFGENVFGGEHGGHFTDGGFLLGVGEDEDVFPWDETIEALDGLFEKCVGSEEV